MPSSPRTPLCLWQCLVGVATASVVSEAGAIAAALLLLLVLVLLVALRRLPPLWTDGLSEQVDPHCGGCLCYEAPVCASGPAAFPRGGFLACPGPLDLRVAPLL